MWCDELPVSPCRWWLAIYCATNVRLPFCCSTNVRLPKACMEQLWTSLPGAHVLRSPSDLTNASLSVWSYTQIDLAYAHVKESAQSNKTGTKQLNMCLTHRILLLAGLKILVTKSAVRKRIPVAWSPYTKTQHEGHTKHTSSRHACFAGIAERLQVVAPLWHTYMTVLQKSFNGMS